MKESYSKEEILSAIFKTNSEVTDDCQYAGALTLASNIFGISENELSEIIYDGFKTPEIEENYDNLLWNILKEHFGHRVEIAIYGDTNEPDNICIEDMDTNEIILDAGIYTICARED